jgi:hypothetical protein
VKPEPVFTGSQWDDIRAAKSAAGPTSITVDNHVYLGTREITDIVDQRVEVGETSTVGAIDTGRYV